MRDLIINGYCQLRSGKLILNDNIIMDSKGSFNEIIEKMVKNHGIVHPRFGKMDRLSQLGYSCTEILLQLTGKYNDYQPWEVSLLFANASSSLDTDFRFQKSVQSIASPSLFVYTLPNILLAEICIKNGFKGENSFLISDVPDADLYLAYITQLFANQQTKICIAGWAEILGEQYNCSVFVVEERNDNNNNKTKNAFNNVNVTKVLS